MKFDLSEVLELPVAEKLRLVEAIWDSIAVCPEQLGLNDAERKEPVLSDVQAKSAKHLITNRSAP